MPWLVLFATIVRFVLYFLAAIYSQSWRQNPWRREGTSEPVAAIAATGELVRAQQYVLGSLGAQGPILLGPGTQIYGQATAKWNLMAHICVKVNLKPQYWHLSACRLPGTALAPNDWSSHDSDPIKAKASA